MPAGILNITVEQGATFKRILKLKDGEGELIDLTGYTDPRAKLKPSFDASSDDTYEFDVAIDDDPTTGQIIWSMAAEDTAAIEGDFEFPWVYDLEINEPSGDVIRILRGAAIISAEVTTA